MTFTVAELLERRISESPDRVYLKYHDERAGWNGITWSEYGERIAGFSRALLALGAEKGDRIAIIGTSSPDWFVTDMSIMTIGCITVPIYFTSSSEQITYILDHAEVRYFIILGSEYLPGVQEALKHCRRLEKIITPDDSELPDDTSFMKREEFLRMQRGITPEQLDRVRRNVTPEDVAAFIYTSGTTGPPKAVMLVHRNCCAAAKSAAASMKFLDALADPVNITCFLTLSHVFERSYSLMTPMETGAVVHFADLSRALEEIREIKPTIVVGLPRTWEKIYEAIMGERDRMSLKKQRVFDWALRTGMRFNHTIYEKRRIPFRLKARHWMAKRLVIDKILAPLGFENARHFMTGGAVSSKEIIDFFFSLGVWICQVYGQTESHGMGSIETRDKRRFGSVGIPFPGIEISISGEGEILMRGDVVSPGYYKDPGLTRETFRDGWLYTGDLGYIDEDGYLFITGRRKDIIITSGAKNITPAKIEASLMSIPLVEHAVVVGDGRKYLTALLTLNLDEGIAFARKQGRVADTYRSLLAIQELRNEIERQVNEINATFSRVEQIKKFAILSRPLSIEAGDLTSLNKIKRYAVIEKYAAEIENLYS